MALLQIHRARKTATSSGSYEGVVILEKFNPEKRFVVGSYEKSASFVTGSSGEYAYHVKVFQGGHTGSYSEYVCVKVFLENKNLLSPAQLKNLKLTHVFACILDSRNKKRGNVTYVWNAFSARHGVHAFPLMKREEIAQNASLLTDGDLRVHFSVHWCSPATEAVAASTATQAEEVETRLASTNRKLLETGLYSDVKIVVGVKEFGAHRAILAACSSIFQEMFDKDVEKGRASVIKMEGVKEETIQSVLDFIYTGKVNEELAEKVIVVAQRYEIMDLKKVCEDMLAKRLSQDNIYRLFQLAYDQEASHLQAEAKKYVFANAKHLAGDPSFRQNLKTLTSTPTVDPRLSFYVASMQQPTSSPTPASPSRPTHSAASPLALPSPALPPPASSSPDVLPFKFWETTTSPINASLSSSSTESVD